MSSAIAGSAALHRVSPIVLARAPKHTGGAHRIVSPAAAWARVRQAVEVIGITRLADLTGLDRLGVPAWSAVRPMAARFGVSVTCGKGLRSLDARIGAVMEAVEYWAAEPDAGRLYVVAMDALDGESIDPDSLALPSWSRGWSHDPLAWSAAWDLTRQHAVWVPANAVHFPFENQPGRFLFTPTTNGLAAGMAIEEAVCHALAELIERDAWSLVCARVWAGAVDSCPVLDVTSVPEAAGSLLRRFERADVRIIVHDITSDVGVAAFHATSIEATPNGPFIHEGMGAHPDAEVALLRALTEVAQSRAADIQGSREDLTFWRARSLSSAPPPPEWLEPSASTQRVRFADVPDCRSPTIRDDIDRMIARLAATGLDRVIVADLTSPVLGLPVIRAIVPGLEVMCVDPWRIGPRVDVASAPFRDRCALPSPPRH